MPVKRGEIYWVEFDPVKGSEQGGLRPALVVQNDTGNRYNTTTVVAAIFSLTGILTEKTGILLIAIWAAVFALLANLDRVFKSSGKD